MRQQLKKNIQFFFKEEEGIRDGTVTGVQTCALPIFVARFQRLMTLGDAEAMLQWDWAAMMPSGSAEARSEQLAVMKAIGHGLLVSPEIEELLEAAESDGVLDIRQTANLRRMKHMWLHESALTEDIVTALSKASSKCETAWRTARPESNFAAVRPGLEALLDLVREAAAAKAERLGLSPYDALLDKYDPSAGSD